MRGARVGEDGDEEWSGGRSRRVGTNFMLAVQFSKSENKENAFSNFFSPPPHPRTHQSHQVH